MADDSDPEPEAAVNALVFELRALLTVLIDADPDPASAAGKLLIGIADAIAEWELG
jgi:hypothetical protein